MSNSEASCFRVPQLIGQQLVAQLRQIPRGQIDIDVSFSRSGARRYTHLNVGRNNPVRALAQDWRFRHFEAQERRKRPPWLSPGGLIPAYILFRFSIAGSQAPAWEYSEGSSSFPKHRKLELSRRGFPSCSLGTRAQNALFDLEYKNIRRRACRARLWSLGEHGKPYICEFAKQSASQLTQSNRRDGVCNPALNVYAMPENIAAFNQHQTLRTVQHACRFGALS
ncbi:hypothetical protein [Methylobacter sp.]|uniref:hypothetical protein n=1 Tax=Methylobacter sp. TaxID=2051955 RepID=UPI002FDEC43B